MFSVTNRSAGNQDPSAVDRWSGDQNWLQKHHNYNTLILCRLGQVTGESEALAYEVGIALERFGVNDNKVYRIGCLRLTVFRVFFFLKQRQVWVIQLNSSHTVKIRKPHSNI